MKSKFIWLFLLTLALVSLSSQAYADWNTAQGNQQRTGLSPYSVDESKLRHAWTFDDSTAWRATASSPAIYGDTVYAVWGASAAASRKVSSHNVSTGALNWSYLLPGASRTTPAVFSVDTTGAGNFAVLVFVGNGAAAAGVAGVDAIRTNGTMYKRYLTGLGEDVSASTPVVVDTNTIPDGKLDLIIACSNRGKLFAWNIRTAVLTWGPITLPSFSNVSSHLNSLALSPDDSVVYANLVDFNATWEGNVKAVSTRTGAVLGTFTIAASGFVSNPTVLNNNTVLVNSFNPIATGFGRRVRLLDRLLTTASRTPFDNGSQRGGGAIWPDVSGDTFYYAPSEELSLLLGWSVSAMRAANNNPASLVAVQPICDFPPGPVAISASGTGIVSTGFFGAYNEMNVFDPATGFLLWNKPYVGANTITGFNRSNVAFADGSASDVVVVAQDAAGYLIGLKEDATPHPRFEQEPVYSIGDACPVLFMNIPLALNGSVTDTAEFINIGTASGSYTAIVAMAAQAGATGISSKQVRYSNVSRSRQNLALKVSDDLAATVSGKFLPKSTASFLREIPDERAEEFLQATSFQLKQKASAQTASPPPAWLTLVDLTTGGPIAVGDVAKIEATASSATLGLGEYFADIEIVVTPGDPDPDYYGGTEVIYPVHLVVGFIAAAGPYCEASDAALWVTNVGKIGEFADALPDAPSGNFVTSFGSGAELFEGSFYIYKPTLGDTCLWFAIFDTMDFIPDADIASSSFDPTALTPNTPQASAYLTQVSICSTAFVTTSSVAGHDCCTLRVRDFTIGLWDGAFCDSVIFKKYVIKNVGGSSCDDLTMGVFGDWDITPGSSVDDAGGDTLHNILYQFDPAVTDHVFGYMRKPSDDLKTHGQEIDNQGKQIPGVNWGGDSLKSVLDVDGWSFDATGIPGPLERSMAIYVKGIDLAPGAEHVEEYVVFGWDTSVPLDAYVWKTWLRQNGYYRGDVNTDNRGHERSIANADLGPAVGGGKINVTDVIYLARYVLSGGARPWPFDDQGDLTGDGASTLADVISLANFVFKGVVPNDRNRFGPGSRTSLKENPNWY